MTARRVKVLKRVGGPGHWVSIVRRPGTANLSLRWWNPELGPKGNYQWETLGHADAARAEATAREKAAELLQGVQVADGGPVRLAYLFSRYRRDVTAQKPELQQRDDRRRIDVWTAHLGADFDPLTLTVTHLKTFEQLRRAGALAVPGRQLQPARNKTIREDEVFLTAVFNWAASIEAGVRLLPRNPMAGYQKPREINPRRPRTSYDVFLELDAVADVVDPQRLFRGFLQLLEALGWRASAICELRACDLDLRRYAKVAPHGRILKREETDKVGVEQWVPLSKPARAAIDLVLNRNTVVGEAPLFPAPRSRKRVAWTRHRARALLLKAYKEAEVPAEERVGLHAYRRKWATERKHLPRKDVAAAGAWLSPRTLDIYEQADQETILAVVSETKKLRRPKEIGAERSSRRSRQRAG